MSYLHCPTCKCAYNVARERACPRCAATADPVAEVVAAAEQLARAIARAAPADLAAADAMLARRALPGDQPAPPPLPAIPDIRRVLRPPPPVDPRAQHALLTTVALALLARIATPPRVPLRVRSWARALLAR